MLTKQNELTSNTSAGRIFFLFLTLLSFTIFSQAQGNQGIDTTFNPIPSQNGGNVSAAPLVQPDGKIIIYGTFQIVQGVPKNRIARLNADGTLDNSFDCAACDFNIWTVALQPDGKLILAGVLGDTFSVGRMIRLNTDGSLDTTFTSPFSVEPSAITRSAAVLAVQPDGKIYATQSSSGFMFSQTVLYRLNPNGSFDNSFAPMTFDHRGWRHSLGKLVVLPDGKLMMGGNHHYGVLFRVNPDGTKDNSFESPILSHSIGQIAPAVISFEIQADGKIPFIGTFESVNGIPRNSIARLNADQSLDTTYTPNAPFDIFNGQTARKTALQSDGKLLVSSVFSGAQAGKVIVRLNADGSVDNTFNEPSTLINIATWTLDASERILLFGDFQGEGYRFARLNTDGSLDATFNPSIGTVGQVYSLAIQADGKVIISGYFTKMNNVERKGIARVNADGSLDASFNPGSGFDVPPTDFAIQPDGKILAIGEFSSYNGTPRMRIARLNADGSLDLTFNPTVTNLFAVTVQPDGKILIGGSFTTVNGTARTGIARLNTDGSLDNTFNPTLGSPTIRAILVQADGKIMVGGTFAGVNGFNRQNFIRLNSDGTLDASFNAGTISAILAFVQQTDGKYVVMSGVTVFRRNNDGTADATFQNSTYNGTPDAMVRLSDGTIVVAGNFTTVNNVTRLYIGRLKPDGRLDTSFIPGGANARVRALAVQSDDKIIAGGDFTIIGGVFRPGIARINYTPFFNETLFDYDGDGKADISVFRPSENKWYVLRSSDGQVTQQIFAITNDVPAPADYDGDGKTDFAIFRAGDWWSLSSMNGTQVYAQWGQAGDIPRPSDYDGDGRTDYVAFRPSNNTWYRISSANGASSNKTFGLSGDKPVTGDFDGDGKSDVAIYRPSTGDWWWQSSVDNVQRATHWGISTDIPAPADYDGDGKTDFAVYRPSTGVWYIYNSATLTSTILNFGISEDKPVPADYDGDGKADIAVFRPSTGVWYLQQSTAGFTAVQFGISTDIPTPNAFIP